MVFTYCQLIRALVLLLWPIVSTLSQSHLPCDSSSSAAYHHRCDTTANNQYCQTFALLRTNSYYSSLSNLTFYLGINRFLLAQANGFSSETEFLPKDQPLLIPIDCKCTNGGGLFQAILEKTTLKGESFNGIAGSLEGLATCNAIREKNPKLSPWDLGEKLHLLIPIPCACQADHSTFLLSYPVNDGDTVQSLAAKFNITSQSIISANNQSEESHVELEKLTPSSTLLIPLKQKPFFGSLANPQEPNMGLHGNNNNPHKRRLRMMRIGVYTALSAVLFAAAIAVLAVFLVIQWRRKKQLQAESQMGDLELQKLNLSIRTTTEKKVSFDQGSQDTLDGQILDPTTPHKMLMEAYTVEELNKATEDFDPHNLIEGNVYHGRLNGKNLAIKRAKSEMVSQIDFGLFHHATHHHPNIIRMTGTCLEEGPDSFLAFEYAKNGSLKDWLHGGLAMKSQFIASCYCFLNWNQRLRICLDVATALQYMHHIMIPGYVHKNIKSRNIFLDEEFNAKVGNFGMANCVDKFKFSTTDHDLASCSSYSNSWDKGYLAPEISQEGIVSPSIDIFAYGVVLLEALSGKTPITRGNEKGGEDVWLSDKIKSVLESENVMELRDWMDNALGENYSFDAAVTLANLARSCVERDPSLRPSAGEIVEKVSRLVEELPEGDQFSVCESSSKPLVKAAGK